MLFKCSTLILFSPQELARAQHSNNELQTRIRCQDDEIARLDEDRARLAREIEHLKASFAKSAEIRAAKAAAPAEMAMRSVGPLKVYEIAMGLVFLYVMWIWFFA